MVGDSRGSNVNSDFTNYEINVLIIYREGSESYREVFQNYAQSLYVGTHVKAVSHIEFTSEDLKTYDLIYPDVSLVGASNNEEMANNLTNYVRDGGSLFLEEDLHRIFPNDVLGMSKIIEVDCTEKRFVFPIVPQKYDILQNLWKIYSVKKGLSFYDIIRHIYHKFKRDNDVPAKYDIDLTKVELKIHALPDTAISLVNSNGFTLLSLNKYGKGTVLWTINHIPKRGTYFGKPFTTRLDLGHPDPKAKNFHFGYATINYLMRNAYLDFIAKEKYGFSIQKIFGTYGRPSFSWQNHLDVIEIWENDEMIHWIDILKDVSQIPTFSFIRGANKDWGVYHGVVILNLNEGDNSDPIFTHIGSDSPYLLSGTRLQQVDGSCIEVEAVSSPFVVDWTDDGKKDLIVGTGAGNVYYYQNVGTNDNPVFSNKEIIKEDKKDLNVGCNASPFVVDWNGDGKKDLIVGAGDGNIYYYENIGTNEKPVFSNKGTLQGGEKDLNVGSNAAPFVVDWNEDGKKDLLVGAEDGKIYYYENVGTDEEPAFLNKEAIKEGEKDLNVGCNAAPFVVDWNEDRKKDLIVGAGDGNVYHCHNIGTNEKPVFHDKKIIRKSETDMKHFVVVQSASPFVVDWNEDGKKDLVIGAAEHCVYYAINSPYLMKEVRRNVNYALNHSICIIPHYYVGYNYTTEQELYELEMHKNAFADLGIPWTKTLGTNHHGWYAHAVPVWQTIYTEKNFGLAYDFGFETMGADFIESPCTTHPYMPYGMPFLLMKDDTEPHPFIIWTPNTIREYTTFDSKSGLFVFPVSFDLPVTYYFHPEHAFKHTKRDIFYSYLLCLLKYRTIPTRLDLQHGEAYKVIRSFNKLRDEHEYNMMSEEQAAKAMLNMYYTTVNVKINGSKLTLIPDIKNVPETAEEYKNTLGIKIELHPDFESKGVTTDSSIYYKPTNGQIYLGLYKETHVNLNERAGEVFHLVRFNVPFELNNFSDHYEITVKSSGMRQFKIFSPYQLKLKVKNSVVGFEKKGNYYVVTDYGDLNKTISLILKKKSILFKLKGNSKIGSCPPFIDLKEKM